MRAARWLRPPGAAAAVVNANKTNAHIPVDTQSTGLFFGMLQVNLTVNIKTAR